jgi:dihydroflavonol-4-reductase
MRRSLVTGGTGFVGANLVRELLADGDRVRVLARAGGDRRALEGCDVEIVEGDLLDPASVRRAAAGMERVYHVAADYRLWAPDPSALFRANVDGTRHVLEAAVQAGASRIVYTSTVGVLGIPKDGRPGDETTPVSLADMVGPYKASKFVAEEVARELAARGAPVVIVNPSAPIGPWDVKPTPTGQMVVDFLRRKMVASLDTGLNIAHVRDVARGHILAAERGRIGDRYVLGHVNLTLLEIFRALARLTGLPAPRFRVPYSVAWLAAAGMEGVARLTGRAPAVPLTAVRMARKRMFFSVDKAVSELGLPQTLRIGRSATRWTGSWPGATRLRPRVGGPRESVQVRLAAHAKEPVELLLRLPPASPRAAGGDLRRLRLLPDRRRRGGRGGGPRSPARRARRWREEIARVWAPGSRSIPRRSGCARRCGSSPSRGKRWRRSSPAWRWTWTRPATRRSRICTRTATAWPPRSASAVSPSSATPIRARRTTRSTWAWPSS